MAFCLNIIVVILGGAFTAVKVRELNNPQVKKTPHITSFWDLFRPSKINFHHPYFFAEETIKRVEAWREKEIERQKKEKAALPIQNGLSRQFEEEIETIKYAQPPPEYWTSFKH